MSKQIMPENTERLRERLDKFEKEKEQHNKTRQDMIDLANNYHRLEAKCRDYEEALEEISTDKSVIAGNIGNMAVIDEIQNITKSVLTKHKGQA